jgi:hypothetical protein
MKKSVVILIVAVATLVSACNVTNVAPQPSQSGDLLNSIVQITMYIFSDGNGGVNSTRSIEQALAAIKSNPCIMNIGLGTVVQVEGQITIITHNHWRPLSDVGLVQFSDANGTVVISMTPFEFEKLILFQDAGTTILIAPANLGIAPATMGSPRQAAKGQIVSIVRRQPGNMNQIEVVQARIVKEALYESLEAWKLQAMNGDFISPGDSGGGIWLNGQWIGNTWSIKVVEHANGDEEAEGTIFVAQCPAQVFSVVANNQPGNGAELDQASTSQDSIQSTGEELPEGKVISQ